MTHKQLMRWGKRWRYPGLWIGAEESPATREYLGHGEEHYNALSMQKHRMALAALRIERWNALVPHKPVVRLVRVEQTLPEQEQAV